MQAFLPTWFNRFTGRYNPGNTYTVGGLADSYYEYLLKLWILRDRRVGDPVHMFGPTPIAGKCVAAPAKILGEW